MSRDLEVMEELGKRKLISVLKKILSKRSKVGSSLPFDQVNRRSRSGSSSSAKASTVWLNRELRVWLKASLFLSDGHLIRLKSPAITHAWFVRSGMCCSKFRNSAAFACTAGP